MTIRRTRTLGRHGQVLAVANRLYECRVGGFAPTVADRELLVRHAFVTAARLTQRISGMPTRTADLRKSSVTGCRCTGSLTDIGPSPPARSLAPRSFRSDFLKYGRTSSQPQPSLPSWAQMVEVERMASHVDHPVDGARPSERLAARPAHRAAIQAGDRLRRVPPVEALVLEEPRHACRSVDPEVVGRRARLQQEHALLGVLGQPRGDYAARGARADDNVVKLVHGLNFQLEVLSEPHADARPSTR